MLWLSGHTHEAVEVKINDISIHVNPVGYPHEQVTRETYLRHDLISYPIALPPLLPLQEAAATLPDSEPPTEEVEASVE